MTLAKRCEDDLLKAPTVVGVRKHPDLIHNECLVYAGDIAARVQTIIMTVCRDVVYSDDETYGQKQVPVNTTDNNTQKENMAGNSSPRVHAYLQAVMPGMEKVALDRVRIGGEQSSGALTVRSDVVYSDDETYGQKQVPVDTTDNNKHQKDNQLAGNSSPRVHACLQAVMPAAIPKGGMEEVVFGGFKY